MRILFIALLFMSYSAQLAFSQSEFDNTPVTKDNTGLLSDSVPHKNYKFIHIVSLDSNAAAYRSIGQFLTDKGWSITTGNIDFLSLTTQYASLGTNDINASYQLTIKGHDIKITTYGKRGEGMSVRSGMIGMDLGTPFQLLYKESFMLISKKAWLKVVEILSEYPHSKIYYSLN